MQGLLWLYEFDKFDTDHDNNISVFDLAQSFFVYYVPFQKIDDYINHLRGYSEYKKSCCSSKEYIAFQYFMKMKSEIVGHVLARGSIDLHALRELRDKFQASNEYCKRNNVHLCDHMLEAFLHALDLDGNGILD